jgi:hypothetical protein
LDHPVVEILDLIQGVQRPRSVEFHGRLPLGECVSAVAEPLLVYAGVHQALPVVKNLDALWTVERGLRLVVIHERPAGLPQPHVEETGVAEQEPGAGESSTVAHGQRLGGCLQLRPGGRRLDARLGEHRLVVEERAVVDQQRQAVELVVDLHLRQRGLVEGVEIDIVFGHEVVDRLERTLGRVQRRLVPVPEHEVGNLAPGERGEQLLLDELLRDIAHLVLVLRRVEGCSLFLQLSDLVARPGSPHDHGLPPVGCLGV